MTVTAPVEVEPKRESRSLGRLVKIVGVVVSLIAAVLTGFFEIILAPVRAGGIPVGAAIVAAVVANYAIAWFAYATVGRRWAIGPPWALWTLFMLFAAGTRTTEGDYLIAGDDWVALAMILLGSLTFAVFAYRMILRPPATPAG